MIVSAMLAFMGISGFIGRKNISKLEFDLKFPEEIYAKREFPIRIIIKNKKRFLPSFILRIHLFDKELFVPYIGNKEETELHLFISFEERGMIHLDEIYVCSVFPFNFFVRCNFVKINKNLIVFPKPEKCAYYMEDNIRSKGKGEEVSGVKGFEGDILSIRDYTSGDPLKYIHWKASAKTGKLKTKELTFLDTQPVVVDLESIGGSIERKVSCGTYMILNLYKRAVPFGLKTKEKFYRPEYSYKQKIRLLKELAVYGKD
ncbi:DUF58 domain-containing protein [Persephonella sp.]